MSLRPADIQDLTPAQLEIYLALRKNLQAEVFMAVMVILFIGVLTACLVAAFGNNQYAYASIMGLVDGLLGAILWRMTCYLFPLPKK